MNRKDLPTSYYSKLVQKQNMSTSYRIGKYFSVAKKSTIIEAILTCNWILGFEVYGMSGIDMVFCLMIT